MVWRRRRRVWLCRWSMWTCLQKTYGTTTLIAQQYAKLSHKTRRQLCHAAGAVIVFTGLFLEKEIGGSFTTAAYSPETNSVKTTNPNLNKWRNLTTLSRCQRSCPSNVQYSCQDNGCHTPFIACCAPFFPFWGIFAPFRIFLRAHRNPSCLHRNQSRTQRNQSRTPQSIVRTTQSIAHNSIHRAHRNQSRTPQPIAHNAINRAYNAIVRTTKSICITR